jgi:hypothetical protein
MLMVTAYLTNSLRSEHIQYISRETNNLTAYLSCG